MAYCNGYSEEINICVIAAVAFDGLCTIYIYRSFIDYQSVSNKLFLNYFKLVFALFRHRLEERHTQRDAKICGRMRAYRTNRT